MKNGLISRKETVPVFFATDDNYAPFLAVALESMLANASRDYRYAVYVLTTGISPENRLKLRKQCLGRAGLEFVDIGEKLAEYAELLHMRDYYTSATYFRFFIPSLFPQYDKCLYLDCDIIVRGDISELYSIELGDNYISAVVDDMVVNNPLFGLYTSIVLGIPGKEYFNAGILSMNLKALRENDLEALFTATAKKRRFPVAQDQDYLNVICKGKIVWAEHAWNHASAPVCRKQGEREPAIVHFKMNYKPWHYRNIPYQDEFWYYAGKTAFHNKILGMLNGYSKEDEERDEKQSAALADLIDSEIGDCGIVRQWAAN